METRPIDTGASPFNSLAASYDAWFKGEGELTFAMEKVISTLFQKPGIISREEPDRVEHMELPQSGYSSSAGFTVIVVGKLPPGSHHD